MPTIVPTNAVEIHGIYSPDDILRYQQLTFDAVFTMNSASSANYYDEGTGYGLVLNGNSFGTISGVITSLTVMVDQTAVYTVTGLSISYDDFLSANDESADAVAELFDGQDWLVDVSAFDAFGVVYGTGGNDRFDLGGQDDYVMLDGGTDFIDTGAGDDIIQAGNFFGFSALGTTTLDGGDDIDTLYLYAPGEVEEGDLEFFTSGIDLILGARSKVGSFHLSAFNIEEVHGTMHDDRIIGDSFDNRLVGRGGADALFGDLGADRLEGGAGADRLAGETGVDVYVYTAPNESRKTDRDLIVGFERGFDQIDLSSMDPDTPNDKFVFIGSRRFGRNEGELRYELLNRKGTAEDRTVIEADFDGNGRADLQIELDVLTKLARSDFVL